MKKYFAVYGILILIVIMLFSACGKDKTAQGMEELRSAEVTGARFSPEKTTVSSAEFRVARAVSAGESIFCAGVTEDKYQFYRIDTVSNTAVPISGLTLDSYDTIDALSDGRALVTYIDSDGGRHFALIGADNSVSQFDFSLPEAMQETHYFDIMLIDGGFLFNDGYSITGLDGNGAQIFKSETFEEYTEIIRKADDGLLLISQRQQDNKMTVKELGQDFKPAAEYTVGEAFSFLLPCCTENELFVSQNDVIYRVNYKTGEKQSYANVFASGCMGGYSFIYLDDQRFFDGTKSFTPAVWRPFDEAERQTLTLGAYLPDTYDYISGQELKNAINKFNEANEKYYIELIDYAAYGENGFDIFLTDINSGNTPDIYDLYYFGSDLAMKGILQDLKPLFQQDGEVSLEEINPAVLNTLEEVGRLYYLVPNFTATTLMGRLSIVGGQKLSFDRLCELAQEYGASEVFDTGMSRQEYFIDLLISSANEFVDFANAECSFDSPEFIRRLEYAQQLPDTNVKDNYGGEAYAGSAVFMKGTLQNPVNDYLNVKSIFQGDVCSVGFPSSSGNGVYMTATMMLGMAADSPNQECVWEFFKYLLGSNYQWNCANIPVIEDIMEQRIEAEVERFRNPSVKIGLYIPAENGEPSTDIAIDYIPADDNTKAEVMAIINSIDSLNEYDVMIYNIVMNEAEKCYNGVTSIEETAAAIQSRASIYMAEQYG